MRRGAVWVQWRGPGVTRFSPRNWRAALRVRLHLIGASPAPDLPRTPGGAPGRCARASTEVAWSAREKGENPIEAWQEVEKASSIQASLDEFERSAFTPATTPAMWGDRDALANTLGEDPRRRRARSKVCSTPASVATRIDHKRPARGPVLGPKLDGAFHLMDLTPEGSHPALSWATWGSIDGASGPTASPIIRSRTTCWRKLQSLRYRGQRRRRRQFRLARVGRLHHPRGRRVSLSSSIGMPPCPRARASPALPNWGRGRRAKSRSPTIATRACSAWPSPRPRLRKAGRHKVEHLFQKGRPMPRAAVRARWPSAIRARSPSPAEHKFDGTPLLPFAVSLELSARRAAAFAGRRPAALRGVRAAQALWFAGGGLSHPRGRGPAGLLAMHGVITAEVLGPDGRVLDERRPHFEGELGWDTVEAPGRSVQPAVAHRDLAARRLHRHGFELSPGPRSALQRQRCSRPAPGARSWRRSRRRSAVWIGARATSPCPARSSTPCFQAVGRLAAAVVEDADSFPLALDLLRGSGLPDRGRIVHGGSPSVAP